MNWIADVWNIVEVRRITISILVVLAAFIIWHIVKKIAHSYKHKNDEGTGLASASSIHSVIYDTIKVAIFAVLILVILQVNGVNVTSLIAGLSVASAVVGLALQDFLKDIIMGIHVLMDDFFRLGDMVKFGDKEGTVISFNLRTTKLRELATGDIITLCNRNFDQIIKSSCEVYIRISLPYELPVGRSAQIMELICKEAGKGEYIEKCSFLGTTDYTSSGVDHLIRLDIEAAEHKLSTRRYALRAAREVLEKENLEIPYEQMDVHMK